MTKQNTLFAFLGAITALVLSLHFGASHADFFSLFSDSEAREILLTIRLPRVLLALIVGAGLSLSGLIFQSLFQNPLASPYTLGVAGGAALGAGAWTLLGGFAFITLTISGFLGAFLTVVIVSVLSRRHSAVHMLLCGVMISFFSSSLLMLLQYLSDYSQTFQISRWLMGSLSVLGFERPIFLALSLALVCYYSLKNAAALDLISLSEEFAQSCGVGVAGVRKRLFFLVSIYIGAVVSYCGVIGFVGIIVPHLAKLLVGASHRRLIPATLFLGAILLCLSDLLARVIISPAEIPVGVITGILGAPAFLWILAGKSQLKIS